MSSGSTLEYPTTVDPDLSNLGDQEVLWVVGEVSGSLQYHEVSPVTRSELSQVMLPHGSIGPRLGVQVHGLGEGQALTGSANKVL